MNINKYLDNKLCASTDEDNVIYIVEAIDNGDDNGGVPSIDTQAFKDSDTADKVFTELVKQADPSLKDSEIEEFLNDGAYYQDSGNWVSIRLVAVRVQ